MVTGAIKPFELSSLFEDLREIRSTFVGNTKPAVRLLQTEQNIVPGSSSGVVRSVKPGPTKRAEICSGRRSFSTMMAERYLS